MTKNFYQQHQNFLKIQKQETQKKYKNIRFFDRHVGLFYTKNGSPQKINKKGMSDIWALLKTPDHTYHFEIEIKTGNARLSSDQKKWSSFCDAMGVHFFLVTPDNPLVYQIDNFLGNIGGKDANTASRGLF